MPKKIFHALKIIRFIALSVQFQVTSPQQWNSYNPKPELMSWAVWPQMSPYFSIRSNLKDGEKVSAPEHAVNVLFAKKKPEL